MKSPFYFIVRPVDGKRYDNVMNVNGADFIVSTSIEDHKVVNRFGEVIEVPMFYKGPIKKGDTLVVHHNVFRIYYDQSGNERSNLSHYKDDIYLIDDQQFFLYKTPGEDWNAPYPYCFVSPIEARDTLIKSEDHLQALEAVVEYIPENDSVKKGDLVSFQPHMEYEFTIDNRLLYRMKLSNLCLKL